MVKGKGQTRYYYVSALQWWTAAEALMNAAGGAAGRGDG